MCSVDKTGCEAIITQRALVFLSAVASRFRSCGGSAENFVVMLLNDAFHVIHTAVANFNCVFVENFVVPMVFRKVLLDQAQKYFSDVCLDVLTKRRVEPDDVSFLLLCVRCVLEFAWSLLSAYLKVTLCPLRFSASS